MVMIRIRKWSKEILGTLPWLSVVVVVFLLLKMAGLNALLDRAFLDGLMRWQASPSNLPPDGMLVMIDEDSITRLNVRNGQRWPWSRDEFAALVVGLHRAGAKHIVLDLTFLETSEDAMQDSLLAAYTAACEGVVLAETTQKEQILWTPRFREDNAMLNLAQRIATARHEPDSDGVMRQYDYTHSLASAALDATPSGRMRLRWHASLNALSHDFPERVLSAYPFILRGEVVMKQLSNKMGDAEFDATRLHAALQELPRDSFGDELAGKTVFVGANASGTFDVKSTPLSRIEPGVMYHYTAWANAVQGDGIRIQGEKAWQGLVLALVVMLLIFEQGRYRSAVGLFIGVGLMIVLGLCFSAFMFVRGAWFPVADTLLATLLSLGLVSIRAWRTEGERKREVQRLFGNYVSPHVLKELTLNPESVRLGGERKELSVYFSDLAGFTEMSEKLTPEQLLDIINTYLSEMSGFIIKNEGYLDKFIGDAIMGVFGAPVPLEKHALAACTAALQSRDHLIELNRIMQRNHSVSLHARIGVNTGLMVVGNVGSADKINYTVVGDAVNLASRLEGANKEYGTTILIGARTHELLDGAMLTRPVDLLRVKGKRESVQTYEVLGFAATATVEQRGNAATFTRGYELYLRGDFSGALTEFEIAKRINSEDMLTALYVNRCREFMEHPPANWDGVFIMTKK